MMYYRVVYFNKLSKRCRHRMAGLVQCWVYTAASTVGQLIVRVASPRTREIKPDVETLHLHRPPTSSLS